MRSHFLMTVPMLLSVALLGNISYGETSQQNFEPGTSQTEPDTSLGEPKVGSHIAEPGRSLAEPEAAPDSTTGTENRIRKDPTLLEGVLLEGVVTDPEGTPLEDVHLTLEGTERRAISDQQGHFTLQVQNNSSSNVLLATRVGYRPVRGTPDQSQVQDGQGVRYRYRHYYRIEMQPAVYGSETVVVTATRTERDIEEVSIPVTVVSGDEIRRTGSMRLSDVLAEQTGMQIIDNHGSGIQMQGFDPAYTLIMIDGKPLIGRTAGTLDLTRVSVRNVKQIEIVKGPSSALWGSEALAGVVNIITTRGYEPFSGGVTTRYSRFNTLDTGADLSVDIGGWRSDLFINHNRSGGYSLNPNSISQTVPEYGRTTLSYRAGVGLSDRVELEGSVRFMSEQQHNQFIPVGESGSPAPGDDSRQQILNSDESQQEFMADLSVTVNPLDRLDLDLDLLTSYYRARSDFIPDSGLENQNPGDLAELYAGTDFRQQYHKPELKAGYRWTGQHHTLGGGGVILEKLDSERYAGQPKFTTRFLFLQHTWNLAEPLELTGGFRYDAHSEYSSQFSPKVSGRFKVSDRLQFRASVGRGFKAPDFRQLFLNFTNATEGYSVFGSSTVVAGIESLQQQGVLSRLFITVDEIEKIEAESSQAVNAGFDLDLGRPLGLDRYPLRLRLNLFLNRVDDLIETAPVAQKTNGQSVYAYFNVDRAVMQGIETVLSWHPAEELDISLGYQLLDARKRIERERRVQDSDGEVVVRTEASMQPMFNRSRHSGNIKLFYEHSTGWGVNLRGTVRGPYALFDTNGNDFADPEEVEPGYSVWSAALSREIASGVTLQVGADNMLNYRNINQPWLAGRMWYLQASVQF